MSRLLALLLAAAALLAPAAARAADWLRAESPNFVLFTDVREDEARRYLETLELFDFVLRERHGISTAEPARRKLPVYLLRRRGDLRKIRPEADSNLNGFYISTLDDTYAVATAERRDDAVLLHEYVHHFMLQYFPNGYPAWLVEGYAEYFMTFEEKGDRYEVGRAHKNRVDWLTGWRWLPFEKVVTTHSANWKDEGRAMYYAQSWALAHYFLSDQTRRAQLDAYLRGIGRGLQPLAAMQEATGAPASALDQRVLAYLKKGLPYQSVLVRGFTRPQIAAVRLPPSAEDVLPVTLLVKTDNGVDAPGDRTDGPVLLAEARRVAARHPGDRAAELLQARAEIKLGDLAAGEALLARRLAADPDDVEALQLLAAAKLRAAEKAPPEQARALRAEVRDIAGKAFKLDADSYQTLVAYARARDRLPGYPTENDVRVLLDALELAPQVPALRMNAARALARRERHAEVVQVLRPLAFSAHGGPFVEPAKAMMQASEAKLAAAAAAKN